MNKKEYDVIIVTKELKPSLGENKYFAKANIYKIGESEKGPITHNLGESWGKTEEEAYSKMNEKAENWLNLNK